jgi:hypothetical protein
MARFDNWATARYVRNLGESGLRADITETALLTPERKWSGLFCCYARQSSALPDYFRPEVDGATLASTKSTKARTFAGGRRREG